MSFEHAVELKEDYSAKKARKGENERLLILFFFLNMGPFENCSGVHCVVA